MKRIGAVIVGLVFLAAAARASSPAYGELTDDLLKGIANRTAARATRADSIPATDPNIGKPIRDVEWVSIPGGKFKLGTPDFDDAKQLPGRIHTIVTFEVSKTLITVEQYAECVHTKVPGTRYTWCREPRTEKGCNWAIAGRQLHPINCVSWDEANAYAWFKGARLLSESEWEYAATSGGKNQKYPWGNAAPTCGDKDGKNGNVVMHDNGGPGCGSGTTMPVCSKPEGNTEQGLCDMVGNVFHWVQDRYNSSYARVPTDGSAYEDEGYGRVTRGGAFRSKDASTLRADDRSYSAPSFQSGVIGFRLARSSR